MQTFIEFITEGSKEWSHRDIQKLIKKVRSVLRQPDSDKLRKKPYQGHPNPMAGHCYVASEVIHHLTGKQTTPQVMRVPGGTHWFLKHNKTGRIYDPTGDQFDHAVDHSQGRGSGFLTKEPSNRAKELMRKLET